MPDIHRWHYELARALVRSGQPDPARAELEIYRRGQEADTRRRHVESVEASTR